MLAVIRSALESIYERRLSNKLEGLPRPQHVGVMIDGNRRWARNAGHDDPREGYRAGGSRALDLLGWCAAAQIEHVTLFMLSDDNLHRPASELGPLIEIIEETVRNISAAGLPYRVGVIGALDLLPQEAAVALKEAAATTTDRSGMQVDVAVGYGGRREIVDAVKSAFEEHMAAGGDPAELVQDFSEKHISRNLYSSTGRDQTDFIIRTSGEQRLSGFLLWQSAYAEIQFVDCYWPAFRRLDFLRALRSFAGRERRFGR
ncbi:MULTISPECIES: isoprenyl transferase [unclassified Streptomyces]|uniref:isoprenyl transferase n=1 Tax=unclassified Streptomyces TaxID=2593676 RepID=UPI0029621311|nr:isoprenyl transferase [Streptomyces sp. N50]WOX17121.1 isoprenyl transferase [Streptomyces sp. N50]